MVWMLLVLLYGLLKGTREIVKKKSLEKSTVIEVLFFYTLFSFLILLPDGRNAGGVDIKHLFYIALKSLVIFVAWICSFKAINKMPISYYGILDLSRVLFSTLMGAFVLGEVLTKYQIMGLILVATGLAMLRYRGRKGTMQKEDVPPYIVAFALLSCLLNGVSGLMDKILMKDLTSSQLQFWYMAFLVLYYLLYILISRTRIHIRRSIENYWIWILAVLFVIADRALFIANGIPDSKVTIMTLIKQSGCIVTIVAGKVIYHEKNIRHKLLCAAIIVAGIVVAVL